MTNYFGLLPTIIIIIALIIGFLSLIYFLQLKKSREGIKTKKYSLLMISVPRENEKSALAAEQVFASLHGIFRDPEHLKKTGDIQEWLSFEVVSFQQHIEFYVYTPEEFKEFVEGQIFAQYPNIDIREVKDDYTHRLKQNQVFGVAELGLNKDEIFPIKTFMDFEVDPLAGITAAMSKIQSGEQAWMQILLKPVEGDWQDKGMKYVEMVKAGKNPKPPKLFEGFFSSISNFGKDLVQAAVNPEKAAEQEKEKDTPKLPGPVESGLTGIEEKVTKLGYKTMIRLFVTSDSEYKIQNRISAIAGSFKQFNLSNLNGFKAENFSINDINEFQNYQLRYFNKSGYVLNITELASLYHFPNVSVETPHISWTGSKKGEPPSNLPAPDNTESDELTIFGKTDFRGSNTEFGIKTDDRRRHIYTIGKTGTGKSTMLENMIMSDIYAGKGVGVVDPHGDLIDELIDYIPKERYKDVVIFDPADRKYPVGFNLLENVDSDMKSIVASGLVGIFKKIWADSWGPRLEYILRNTILALLDYPGSTMLGILKMLSDQNFRARVVEKITDPVIKDFWEKEFEGYTDSFRAEAINPIQNKVGQFLSSATVRNILGQEESTFTMSDILDHQKIFLINLSKGKMGEDNSALLGAMMITKIQLTAMQRVYIPEKERKDFYLYVDEFQNFATEAFSAILSEARKYRLNLILANQYIAQIPEVVREAIFGNIGTIIAFRVGPSDVDMLTKEFSPVFDDNDLVNLDKYNIYVKMAIDGVTSPAFSAMTLPPFASRTNSKDIVIKQSREMFSKEKEAVEKQIIEWNQKESLPPASLLAKNQKKDKEKEEKKDIKQFEKVGKNEFRRFKDSSEKGWYIEVEPQLEQDIKNEKPHESINTDSSILGKILKN
ncbi:type IV secretory system conjugative DNA transfer family protein [Patescibacteria group bacterium]